MSLFIIYPVSCASKSLHACLLASPSRIRSTLGCALAAMDGPNTLPSPGAVSARSSVPLVGVSFAFAALRWRRSCVAQSALLSSCSPGGSSSHTHTPPHASSGQLDTRGAHGRVSDSGVHPAGPVVRLPLQVARVDVGHDNDRRSEEEPTDHEAQASGSAHEGKRSVASAPVLCPPCACRLVDPTIAF